MMIEHQQFDENITMFYFRDFKELMIYKNLCNYFNGGRYYDMDNIQSYFPDHQYLCFRKVLVKNKK